jgi:hypothetical protein
MKKLILGIFFLIIAFITPSFSADRITSLPLAEENQIKQHIDSKIDGMNIEEHIDYVEEVSKKQKYGTNGINFAVYAARNLCDDVESHHIDDMGDYTKRLQDIHSTKFDEIIREMESRAKSLIPQHNYNLKHDIDD